MKIGIAQSDKEPVTGYLLRICLIDWDHGKLGNTKISVENFALGLSGFIGDLAKQGVFNEGHIHSFIRGQWGPTLKRNQFMAVYKLLRATGPMLDSQKDTSDMEDHFKLTEYNCPAKGIWGQAKLEGTTKTWWKN